MHELLLWPVFYLFFTQIVIPKGSSMIMLSIKRYDHAKEQKRVFFDLFWVYDKRKNTCSLPQRSIGKEFFI